MTLVEAHARAAELREEIKRCKADEEAARKRLVCVEREIAEKPSVCPEVDTRASVLLYVRGKWMEACGEYGEAREALRDAILALIEPGQPKLRSGYIGCKSHDRWACQRCDCSYGTGPRHGSIILSVGLQDPKAALTDEDVAACVAYLSALLPKEGGAA